MKRILFIVAPIVATAFWSAPLIAQVVAPEVKKEQAPSKNIAVLEIVLPGGASAKLDGSDLGEKRIVTLRDIPDGAVQEHRIHFRLDDGGEEEKKFYVRGGWRVRLAPTSQVKSDVHFVPEIGHADYLRLVEFSPDGRLIATTGIGEIVVLWDAQSGRVLRRLTGHNGKIIQIVFLEDGKRLRSFDGKEAIVWDLATGRTISNVKFDFVRNHKSKIDDSFNRVSDLTHLKLSLDLRTVIAGYGTDPVLDAFRGRKQYGEVVEWDVGTETKKISFQGQHEESLSDIGIPNKGKILLTADSKGKVLAWDREAGWVVRQLLPKQAKVDAFSPFGIDPAPANKNKGMDAFPLIGSNPAAANNNRGIDWEKRAKSIRYIQFVFSDDSRFALVIDDELATLVDLDSVVSVRTYESREKISAARFLPGNDQFAVLTVNGDLTLYSTGDVKPTSSLRLKTANAIGRAAISSDGRFVFYKPDQDYNGYVFDVKQQKVVSTLACVMAVIHSITAEAAGDAFYCASFDKLFCSEAKGGYAPKQIPSTLASVRYACLSPNDEKLLLTGTQQHDGSHYAAWELLDRNKLESLHFARVGVAKDPARSRMAGAFKSDGSMFFTQGSSSNGTFWNANTGAKIRECNPEKSLAFVEAVYFGRNNQFVLGRTEDREGTIALWDVATGKIRPNINSNYGRWGGYLVSKDDQSLVLDAASTIASVNPDTGKASVFTGTCAATVEILADSSDGRLVLGGTSTGDIVIWDYRARKILWSRPGHETSVTALAFLGNDRYALSGSADGTLRLWDVATGEELGVLMQYDNGKEWLFVTPQGLFDGSPGGRSRGTIRIGDSLEAVPVDRFFNEFYRPGLLALILKGERPQPEVKLGYLKPPTIRIVSPKESGIAEQAEITVEVEATDEGGGVAGPWLVHNGSEVRVPGKVEKQGKTVKRSFQLLLAPGENTISIKAACSDRSQDSDPATITLRNQKPPERVTLHVLAIGINNYSESAFNLKFAANDAKAIGSLFAERGKSIFKAVKVKTLTDADATSAKIEAATKAIAVEARPEDVLIVFLAGHGATSGSRYYFIPHDFKKGENTSIDEDMRKQGLASDVLASWLQEVRATKRVIIFDTCNSGAAIGVKYGGRDPFAFQGAIETLRRSNGAHTIAAAATGEEAKEIDELGHGLLTYTLLAGMKAVDRGPLVDKAINPGNPENVVDILEWFSYASGHVPRIADKYFKARQNVSVNSTENIFPLLPIK